MFGTTAALAPESVSDGLSKKATQNAAFFFAGGSWEDHGKIDGVNYPSVTCQVHNKQNIRNRQSRDRDTAPRHTMPATRRHGAPIHCYGLFSRGPRTEAKLTPPWRCLTLPTLRLFCVTDF
jgi:hypothetical protein